MTAMVVSAMGWGESMVWRKLFGLSLASWTFMVAGMCAIIGLMWDGAYHASWGRDTFFIPPHDMMYGGLTLAIGMAGAILVTSSLRPRDAGMVHVGPMQAPLSIWIMIVGIVIMFSSAAYDDWWHTNIGHVEGDQVLWNPPHFLGLAGASLTVVGSILFILRETPIPLRGDSKPLWVWERFNAPTLALLLSFTYMAFIVSAVSTDRWMIYDKLRFDGSLYPILALVIGPGVFVVAQRVTNRAGTATFMVALCFVLAGATAFFVKDLLGYPRAASLPMMALVSTVLLDVAFKRFGGGYRWLLFLGPVFVGVFYVSEFFWAWYLTRYPWWPIERTLLMVPVGMVIGTASLLAGAWVAERVRRAGFIHFYKEAR